MKRLLLFIPFSLSALFHQGFEVQAAQQKPSLTLQRARQERKHFEGLLKQQQEMSTVQKMDLHNKMNNHIKATKITMTESAKRNPKLSRALGAEIRRLLILMQKIW